MSLQLQRPATKELAIRAEMQHGNRVPATRDSRLDEQRSTRSVPSARGLAKLATDLAEFEATLNGCGLLGRDSADDLVRRHSDAELLARLTRADHRGPEYELFILELTRYGLSVVTVWVRSGAIFSKAASLGRPAPRRPGSTALTEDDCAAIADIAVTYGLRLFIKTVFEEGQWRADGGASLKTFFIGACLLTFSNAFKAWHPDRTAHEIPTESVEVPRNGHTVDPSDLVIERLSAIEWFNAIQDQTNRRIVATKSLGMTNKQIADELGGGLTERAVEMRLSRIRRRTGKNPGATGGRRK